MNTNFSLHRIKLLLQADWIEYKKSFLLSMGVLFAAWLLILFIAKLGGNDINSHVGIFGIGGFITLIYFCKHIGRKMHKGKGQFLILPASQPEKYTTFLLEGIIYFITFMILFWVGLFLKNLLVPGFSVMSYSQLIRSFFMTNGSEIGILFISSLIFLSYLTFRKHAFFIVFLGMFAYIFLFTTILYKFFSGMSDTFQNYFVSSYLYDTFQFMADYYIPTVIISTIIILYVGYLKLKEKELR